MKLGSKVNVQEVENHGVFSFLNVVSFQIENYVANFMYAYKKKKKKIAFFYRRKNRVFFIPDVIIHSVVRFNSISPLSIY